MVFEQFAGYELWGNDGQLWALAVGAFLIVIVLLYALKFTVVVRLKVLAKRTATPVDDILVEMVDKIHWPFYWVVAAFVGMQYLVFSDTVTNAAFLILVIVIGFYVLQALGKLIEYFSLKWAQKRGENVDDIHQDPIIHMMSMIIKALLWIFGILWIVSNLGFNVTSLLAGVGIGGLAIAFALQKVFEDIFASISIYFDKPFEVGDYIKIGSDSGTIQKIGVKSTRLKTLQGEQLVVSNKELTSARINNYKKMSKRRVAFTLGVTYETPITKLKKIPSIIETVFKTVKTVELDRVHFRSYGDFSLNFEIVYYVNNRDYAKFMDVNQEINFKIAESFQKAKIDFAYPTQTVFLQK